MARALSCLVAATTVLAAAVRPAAAQKSPAGARTVAGRVMRAMPAAPVPFEAAWVTLHRVGADRKGPLDSVRTAADGRFAFRFVPSGDSAALYFVSSSYAGIAYFTQPLRKSAVGEDDATILVYDTTSAAVPIRIRGRHVIVTSSDTTGSRLVIEVYEIANDSSVTRVPLGAGATFDGVLPDAAVTPRAGQSDVAPESITFSGLRFSVSAPIAPGMKQVSVTYRVPTSVSRLRIPILAGTSVLEVLVEDTVASAAGGALKETDAATVGGRKFRRFLASDVPTGATIDVNLPNGESRSFAGRIAIIVTMLGATMLLGLAMGFMRTGRRGPRAQDADDDPDALAKTIAALDAAFESKAAPTAEERADHYESRAKLKARLTAALARRDGLR